MNKHEETPKKDTSSTVVCKGCKKEIKKIEKFCPHCGRLNYKNEVSSSKWGKPWKVLLLIFLLFYLIQHITAYKPMGTDELVEFNNTTHIFQKQSYWVPGQCQELEDDYFSDNLVGNDQMTINAIRFNFKECRAYNLYQHAKENPIKDDFVSEIDFNNINILDLPEFCWQPDQFLDQDYSCESIAHSLDIHNKSDQFDADIDAPEAGEDAELYQSLWKDIDEFRIDASNCRFEGGRLKKEFYYDNEKENFYCGNSDPSLEYYMVHPKFIRGSSYADVDKDGILDVILITGKNCGRERCGSIGWASEVAVFTKYSVHGKIQRINFRFREKQFDP